MGGLDGRFRAEGEKGCVWGVGRDKGGTLEGGRGVQFRRPLWSLENSGIVPAGMQHQQ